MIRWNEDDKIVSFKVMVRPLKGSAGADAEDGRAARAELTVRLLLIADTHVPKRARDLPPQVWDEVARADVVVHAGDWVEPPLLDALGGRAGSARRRAGATTTARSCGRGCPNAPT